jgi:hypothetical protein
MKPETQKKLIGGLETTLAALKEAFVVDPKSVSNDDPLVTHINNSLSSINDRVCQLETPFGLSEADLAELKSKWVPVSEHRTYILTGETEPITAEEVGHILLDARLLNTDELCQNVAIAYAINKRMGVK